MIFKNLKYLFLILLLASGLTKGVAQDEFVHLNWSSIEISDQLPKYYKSIDLADDFADKRYEVKVEYPEFVEVTKHESDMLDLMKADLADTIEVETFIGISRKKGMIDVSFVPLVRREGKYLKLVSCKISLVAKPNDVVRSTAYSTSTSREASRYKAHSVLATGKWVKIRVAEEGVYQLTKTSLANMGFKDINKVKVYGYGGRVQNHLISYGSYITNDFDDLEEIPLYRRNDAVLFFAEGTVRWTNWSLSTASNPKGECVAKHTNNTYSKYSYYFVTEGDNPLQMQQLESPETTEQTLTTYPEHFLIDNDAFSWFSGGRTFYDSYDYANGNSKNYTIETPDIDPEYTSQVTVAFSAKSTSVTTAQITLGAEKLGTLSLSSILSEYEKATIASRSYAVALSGNTNVLNITSTKGTSARLDYIRVCYRRRLKMKDDCFVFSHYTSNPSSMQLEGASANTEIWRVGYPGNPLAKVATSFSGGKLSFDISNPTLRYVAVNVDAAFPSPEVVGSVKNQDLHADSIADLVIIIPESGKMFEQARRLAEFHETHDSLRVKVVRADELYNEFSSGTPDAGAYRRYLKMLYDRNTGDDLPKYLLLFGGCVWDNRGVTSACSKLNLKDYLLCYESEPSVSEVSCYVNEDYFGMLDDDEGANLRYDKVDLGVGRFPVTDPDLAKIIVDKTIAYAENNNQGSWKNAIYFLADDGENNKHMTEAESTAQRVEQYYPNMKVGRIYWDAYKRVSTATGFTYPQVASEINNAINKGALIMNYTGHGAPYCISKEMVLKTADFKNFTNNKTPIWVVASCEITPFDRQEENIGVEAMVNPNGGAIAFFSSSRAVYSTQNSYINNYFMYYVLGKHDGRRNSIGDAMRLCKVNLVSSVDGEISNSRDYGDNKLKYSLMGDPALVLTMPTEQVKLDSINGVALSSGVLPNLSAGSIARFSGHIEDVDGNMLNDFDGQVAITLYDSKDTIVCLNNTNESVDPFEYTSYDQVLFEGNDSVKAGRFSVSMPIPLDIKYSGGNGMAKLYAYNLDKTKEGNGTDERFTINGTDENFKQSFEGPKMFVYLNNPDFKNGQTVNATPYFYAHLQDSDGINISGNGVGHDLELVIDGKESTSYILNNFYQNDFADYTSGMVSYQIPSLPDGEHQLMFRAWDTKNNSSATSLKFVVKAGLRPQISSVALSNNPASTSTMFMISFDRPATETRFVINVYNSMGQKCWTHTETATTSNGYHTIKWDLAANNGVALPSGLYIYEVSISCNGSEETIKRQKMIIARQ
ncbi:MAG: type IX secretion system sortase PorU [Prevotellaceae bacterium]|nr:type IX secretion system sortase PorU [Prevotellaceae bacterium]